MVVNLINNQYYVIIIDCTRGFNGKLSSLEMVSRGVLMIETKTNVDRGEVEDDIVIREMTIPHVTLSCSQ